MKPLTDADITEFVALAAQLFPKPTKAERDLRKKAKKQGAAALRRSPIRRASKVRPRSRKRASVEAADRAWSLAVRERAGHRCERCGASAAYLKARGMTLDAHHLISKAARPDLRWNPLVGIALCRCGCHPWGHRNREAAKALAVSLRPACAALWEAR